MTASVADGLRLCVTGGRKFDKREAVFDFLDSLHAICPLTEVAHGAASGLDKIVDHWCWSRGVRPVPYPAQWIGNAKWPGPARNGRMLREFKPHGLIAFPGNTGTADCVRQARALGIPVMDLRSFWPA